MNTKPKDTINLPVDDNNVTDDLNSGQPFTKEEVDAFYEQNREMVDYITNDVIENHPDVISAREILDSRGDGVDGENNSNHDCVAIAMQEFLAEFPDNIEGIKTVSDFAKVANPEKFRELIENGLNFNDAYKLANFENLISLKKDTSNSLNGKGTSNIALNKALKGHIKTSGSFDKVNDTPVPSDVLEMYKSLCKGWSDEKIKRHFSNSKK